MAKCPVCGENVRRAIRSIESAAESASMILRIDDVFAASKPKEEKPEGPEEEEEGESEF